MKKFTVLSLLISLIASPLVVQAESSEWHKIGRVKIAEGGEYFLFNESAVPWFDSSSTCQGLTIRVKVEDYPLVGIDSNSDGAPDSALDVPGYHGMVSQMLLAIGTDREARFTGITCPASNSTSSIHPAKMETRSPNQ